MIALSKQMYVNGKWKESITKNTFNIYNPSNGEKLYEVPRGSKEDVDQAVLVARNTFESDLWQTFKPQERGNILYEVAQVIRTEKEKMAELETMDCGKPLSQAYADVEAAARYFEYYAGVADKILGDTIPVEPGIIDYTVREPVGVTAHIIPWNYPIQITSRSTAAAIATGNAVVVKPAEDTPATALLLAEIFDRTVLPKGIFNVVTGYGSEAGAALSDHPEVDHITFTGSVETGIGVMATAAKHVTPVTLELGGKSPNIVFEDCNQEATLEWVVRSIVQNAGQTCSAGARLLVESSIHDQFVTKICDKMKSIVIGQGIEDPDMGPLLSEKQFRRVESFIDTAKEEGAEILVGGKQAIVPGAEGGYYFQPTLVDNVDPKSTIAQEEVFGPVLTVFPFDSEEEALKLANQTKYGLVTGIWTRDIGRAHRLADRIRAGQVFINNYGAGGGIQMPFGGYKKSGFGREKGLEALKNYTQVKNVAIDMKV